MMAASRWSENEVVMEEFTVPGDGVEKKAAPLLAVDAADPVPEVSAACT